MDVMKTTLACCLKALTIRNSLKSKKKVRQAYSASLVWVTYIQKEIADHDEPPDCAASVRLFAEHTDSDALDFELS